LRSISKLVSISGLLTPSAVRGIKELWLFGGLFRLLVARGGIESGLGCSIQNEAIISID